MEGFHGKIPNVDIIETSTRVAFFSVTRNWDARRLDDFAKKLALNPIVDCHESGWLWGQVSG